MKARRLSARPALIFLIIGVVWASLFLMSCSDDDDDDTEGPDFDLSGEWNITHIVIYDTCYGSEPQEEVHEIWTITQDNYNLNIVTNDGDTLLGQISERSFTATMDTTVTEGGCEAHITSIVNAALDNNSDDLFSGLFLGTITVNDPTICGYDNCEFRSALAGTRS